MTPRINPKRMYPEGALASDEVVLLCGVQWCFTPVLCMGYCQKHYEKARQDKPFTDDPNAPARQKARCSFDPCERPAVVKGHCATHDNQLKRTGKMWEVKPRVKHTDPARPGKRYCADCDQWKDAEDDFYRKPNGVYQNKCKPCIIAYNSAYAQAKRLREKGVDVG